MCCNHVSNRLKGETAREDSTVAFVQILHFDHILRVRKRVKGSEREIKGAIDIQAF